MKLFDFTCVAFDQFELYFKSVYTGAVFLECA